MPLGWNTLATGGSTLLCRCDEGGIHSSEKLYRKNAWWRSASLFASEHELSWPGVESDGQIGHQADARLAWSMKPGEGNRVRVGPIAFSPDSKTLAITPQNDGVELLSLNPLRK